MFSRYRFKNGLTTLVGNTSGVQINYLGDIRDSLGREIIPTVDDEGHLTVDVEGWDGFRTYRVIELVTIQYKKLYIPVKEFHKLDVFVMDGDKNNVQAKNLGYRFTGGPIECTSLPGYYHVPSYTLYVINRDGVLKNSRTLQTLKFHVTNPNPKIRSKGGYHMTTAMAASMKQHSLSRHRALALTFLEYPDEVDKWVVNHIDGIPGNDDLDNLEWVTRSHNNTHAYENDLKNQHVRVLVKHILTGEVVEYYSTSEASRQLGLSGGSSIDFRLRSKFGTVFQDGTQVKRKDDPREFPVVENPEAAIEKATIAIGVKSRDCVTGEVVEHTSYIQAMEYTGVNNRTIAYRINKDDRSPLRGYQFALAGDDREWPKFTKSEYLETLEETNIPVVARNLITGETREFTSVAKACKHFSRNFTESLRNGKQPLYSNGWQIKYENDEWEHIENQDDVLYGLRQEVVAKNIETGGLILASSCLEMAAVFKCCSKSIKQAAMTRGRRIFKGHVFKLGYDDPWP